MTPAPRPKAYSYIRFSTPEQARGDSLRRQTEAAREYVAAHGLELDQELTFTDLGVSAYRGRNAEDGALGLFLEAVRSGRVPPGSYLLVESLDRVSRQTVRKAVRTMEDIVAAGVNLVDLSDGGRVYNTENLDNDSMAFMFMAMRFMRAHEESATKSRRVGAAWENKRVQLRGGAATKPFTKMLPAWLRWNDKTKAHELVPHRARVIQSIFEKAEQGWGPQRIAHGLNERGEKPWGRARFWHQSYVRKILANRAVVGTFTPHTVFRNASGHRQKQPQEAVENYWPAVVEQELFERVHSRLMATAPRGRNANLPAASVFAGVLKCAHCGGSTLRVSKGVYVYLVCSRANAHAKGCKYLAVRYGDVEQALTENIRTIVRRAPRGRSTAELEATISDLDEHVSDLADTARGLAEELARERSEAIRIRLREAEAELEEARESVRELRERRDTLSKPYVLKRLTALRDSFRRKPLNIVEANKVLKESVQRIVMDAEAGRLTIYWRHAEAPTEDIPFYSRHSAAFRSAEA